MINLMLEPIQDMAVQFLKLVVLLAGIGIVIKLMTKSLPGIVILFVLLIVGMQLQPSTYTNVLLSLLQ